MKSDDAAAALLRQQRGVLSRAQVFRIGVTSNGLQHRTRRGGPWQRLLPGVYLSVTGEPTREQLEMAALLYAGPASVITGPAALRKYQIDVRKTDQIDVLVPASRQRASREFVVLHRTRRMPARVVADRAIEYVFAARAVADTVRGPGEISDVRAIVAAAVQQRACPVSLLAEELAQGPVRGAALLRRVLAEVADGIRSAPEGDLRDLIIRARLPMPLFNPRLYLNGRFLADPDAWWPDFGVIGEVDSRRWHLAPQDYEDTIARHRRLTAAGLLVLHFSPHQLRTEPDRVVRDIASALRAGRPVPAITTRPAAA